jgi:hypothetical protein
MNSLRKKKKPFSPPQQNPPLKKKKKEDFGGTIRKQTFPSLNSDSKVPFVNIKNIILCFLSIK